MLYAIMMHCFGDYVLQNNYLATMKGSDWHIMFVHCMLYTLAIHTGASLGHYTISATGLAIVLSSHYLIDTLKARYNKINELTDQALHIAILLATVTFTH